jgi:putative peptidoglycan lipid II flippase
LTAIVDRHFQSLVQTGGIAAVNYSTQIVAGLASLLAFREIYIVPLSEADRRDEKMERLIIGLLMLAVPLAGIVACLSHDMVAVLFQRGRFDAAATDLTASVLRIYAFVLIPSMITTPIARMLQIVGRTRAIHLIYIANGLFLALFGALLVVWARLDAQGVAGMLLLSSVATSGVAAILIARYGVVVRWMRIGRYFVYAVLVTAVAYAVATGVVANIVGPWLRLIFGGAAYGAVIAGTYFAVRGRLRTISG